MSLFGLRGTGYNNMESKKQIVRVRSLCSAQLLSRDYERSLFAFERSDNRPSDDNRNIIIMN